ncbi:histone-lysine N-methyltransferase, H3 lysine-9 specific SUVH6 [Vigna unguiculata]|uniref:histone-lysine N-methyltransferase, H3 lysine-9 specific SUVH6 n=1 Tax=Vigna unguiculata TaxID=3917 RepID=UPI0010163821|nr:histone-lysine N-methyltransferase, H3 lysine-9 specific SUVH6 [Vigna unguiculata]
MATPENNGHSNEERYGSLMKSGATSPVRPVFKRRKVSATRDFPDGCGPYASRIDEVSNINTAGCGPINGTIVEVKNGEHLAGVKSCTCENDVWQSEVKGFLLMETLGPTADSGLDKDNHMVSSYHVDGSTAKDKPGIVTTRQINDCESTAEDKPGVVTNSQTTDRGLNKESPVDTSHRVDEHITEDEAAKVTLGRTTECSLNQENPVVSSHQVDGSTPEDNPAEVKLGQTGDCSLSLKNREVSSHQVNGCIAEDKLAKVTGERTTDCGLNKENPVVSSRLVDGPTAEDKPAEVPLMDHETLNTEFARTANTGKCDSSYVLESSSPVVEMAVPDDSKHLLSIDNISASSACMVEPITRRYLPQRKVSAVRNFPPLCGRNAPRLGKDKHVCLEGTSSLNNKTEGQQNLAVDDNPLKKVATTDVKEGKSNIQDEYNCKRKLVDIDQLDSERHSAERLKKLRACSPSSEMKKSPEVEREKYASPPETSNHHQIKINSKTVVKEKNRDETKPSSISQSKHKLKGNFNRLQVTSQRKVILGLMTDSECPWRSDKGTSKLKLVAGNSKGKRKKGDSFALPDSSRTEYSGLLNDSEKKPLKKKKGSPASEGMGELVLWEKEDYLNPNENVDPLQIVLRSNEFDVNLTPSSHSNFTGDENDPNVTRKKVRETLRLFQVICRKLLQEVESKLNERANNKRVDLVASKILKEHGKYINTGKQILGCVPGVEVGDEFQYRVELNIVGLHRPIQGGIDYVRHNGKVLATSIVASGGYADDLDNSDVLTYTGQGGNVMNSDKEPEDQKLERGNLALMNSSIEKNPVRVIRGCESVDAKCRTYVYDGLYVVEAGWDEHGPHGKKIFKFRLLREPGQPELPFREVKKSKKFKTREGVCVADISLGKERIPICAVNTIDDDKPPPFNYITSMIYPKFHLLPAEGCDCINGCSDVEKCSCVVKNGGEIPFNHNGAIVQAKPLVYECGPTCKCPSTCYNRVSQLGIKFQLEIFKTQSRGWGVRSLSSIPSGSYICEYIGELLEEKEAELRAGNDEYLFDIGNNCSNSTLWDGLSTLMPDAQTSSCDVVKDGGFTIDAAEFGNIGRFINHSCSPNIIAQNVLYDHHDTRMPHIMFFAADNIPPLQELTYDYNYQLDQVRDSDGNIKRKYCYCGSAECTGRMY